MLIRRVPGLVKILQLLVLINLLVLQTPVGLTRLLHHFMVSCLWQMQVLIIGSKVITRNVSSLVDQVLLLVLETIEMNTLTLVET